MGNVLTWKNALEASYQPNQYNFTNCPIGIIKAVLDFKIWAKHSMAVACYFTTETGIAFQISVFRKQSDKSYKLINSEIDFTECPTNRVYLLTIETNGKGNPYIKSCLLLEETLSKS